MLYLVVINNVIGPINLIVCASCLVLLFFETAFGICIGCKVYNLFNKEQAQLCPGGVCDVSPAPGSGVKLAQGAVLVAFAGLVGVTAFWVANHDPRGVPLQAHAAAAPQAPTDPAEAERCRVPDFAKAIGHEEKWKLHNNCQ